MKNLRDLALLLVMALVAITASAQEASQQLIKNGDFELNPKVERGTSATTGWDARKPVVVTHVDPISDDNPHYAVICCDTIYNEGDTARFMIVHGDTVYLGRGGHTGMDTLAIDSSKQSKSWYYSEGLPKGESAI